MSTAGCEFPGADADLLRDHRFDAGAFVRFQQRVANGELTPAGSLYRGPVEGPRAGDVATLPPPGSACRAALVRRGEEALAAGKVAVVVLAGGMATRFCAGRPADEPVVKATVDVLDGRSFLEIELASARAIGDRYGRPVPFCVMGSFATLSGHHGLARHLEERGAGGDDVHLFSQSISLRLTPDGDVFGATPDGRPLPAESYTTPGHGDFFRSLRESGVLGRLRRSGVEVLMLSNVDNLGASIDPALLGHFLAVRAESGVAMLAETVARVAADGAKVGVVARVEGRARILEGFRIEASVEQSALTDASINTFTFAVDALDRPVPLETHAVRKEVGGRVAIQGETLACEASSALDEAGLPLLPFAAVRVPREGPAGRFFDGRFYPVKAPEDLDRVRELLRLTVSSGPSPVAYSTARAVRPLRPGLAA